MFKIMLHKILAPKTLRGIE